MTHITTLTPADIDDLAALRQALWPRHGVAAHRTDIVEALASGKDLALIARDSHGRAVGFAEASIRHDYVNGCDTAPVAFLEGIYVDPDCRRTGLGAIGLLHRFGLARRLVDAVEAWARQQGYRELASDAPIDNSASHAMHDALGFKETQRVVFFRKGLG
ncbi:aminoglycoside 6'-N-acetyltransferase [Devosia sp.]|uniref:aminoglycoside 6'-N-acetyltransferase n=1 Tax=Devosia sp. TaxID=1871048 RepID=UPI002AFFAB70|nr:aminoglycoside 6'-N-acetyltransferase [Devosia sp.]